MQTQTELLKINNPQLNIVGEWLTNGTTKWKGTIEYGEPLFSISFLQFGDTVKWVKSDNEKANGHLIGISLFKDDKNSNVVQFNCSFNNSGNRIWTKLDNPNDIPEIYNQCDAGKICIIAEMKSTPKIKLYALFVPRSLVKIGRNGLWHVKDEMLETVPNEFRNVLRFGRTGEFKISNDL